MSVLSLHELLPESRDLVHAYLSDVASALAGVDADERGNLLADLEAHLLESLDAASSVEDVAAVVAELGSPESFSASLSAPPRTPGGAAGSGSVFGIPYDVRIPTSERIAERMWNPRDPRIWMPRVFGMGWDVNMGAVAVRLHLIEPDAEDVPLTSTPARLFAAAVAIPVAVTAAMPVSYLALRDSLPAQLPSHWDFRGVPDGFSDQASAFAFLFAMALIPTAWAVWSVFRRRPPLLRGATVGFAALFALLGSSLWLLTLITALTGFSAWWLPPSLVCIAIAVPFCILLWLARAGRRAEQQRDLTRAR